MLTGRSTCNAPSMPDGLTRTINRATRMTTERYRCSTLLLMFCGFCQLASATTISINNINDPGVGFNDNTPVSPVGGNSGTTLGGQRLIVFQQAASQWAALLNSDVTIIVQASMTALTCDATSAVLGSAGPTLAISSFPNAPRANTAYVVAEANALAGSDLYPADNDIVAQFNITLDAGNADCLGGTTWWYGIDPGVAPAAGTLPLLPVVFHELGHGLGFVSLVNKSTGDYLTSPDVPVWAHYLFDTATMKYWSAMTNLQRAASATNDPHLVWTGPRSNKQANEYLGAGVALIVNSPADLGANQAGTANFGPPVPPSGITGDLVLVNDGVAGTGNPVGTVSDGCESPFSNNVNGKIALIDRGYCNFTVKVKNAQDAGATAVIIADNSNNEPGYPLSLGGSDGTIVISSYGISQALGNAIKVNLPSPGVNATLGYANIGVNQGCIRMFAPNPIVSGSSVSHFDGDAYPNLLMEPALNTSIFDKVDLTLPFFADIGWSTNVEDFLFIDGFDPNACPFSSNSP